MLWYGRLMLWYGRRVLRWNDGVQVCVMDVCRRSVGVQVRVLGRWMVSGCVDQVCVLGRWMRSGSVLVSVLGSLF